MSDAPSPSLARCAVVTATAALLLPHAAARDPPAFRPSDAPAPSSPSAASVLLFIASPALSVLAPQVVELKDGARVMLTRNWPTEGLVNGSSGKVVQIDEEAMTVTVRFDGTTAALTKDVIVAPFQFELEPATADEASPASRTQIPLRLAWAMSVHKAQGLTLPRAVMHLERAWACSQVYVALARLASLDGLYLSSALKKEFYARLAPPDSRAVSFYKGLERCSS